MPRKKSWKTMSVEEKLDAVNKDLDTLFAAVEELQQERVATPPVAKLALEVFNMKRKLGMID